MGSEIYCKMCNKFKPAKEFYHKDMFITVCIECHAEKVTENRKVGKYRPKKDELYIRNENDEIVKRRCACCREYKELEQFKYIKKNGSYHSYCLVCMKQKNREHLRRYYEIYRNARMQKAIIDEEDEVEEIINPHEYMGRYCLINPLLRRML